MTTDPRPDPPRSRRFHRLLRRLGVEDLASKLYPVLEASYSEPGRQHYDLARVDSCLTRLDEARGEFGWPDLAELAVWFQDAVNDPAAGDNELRSALMFEAWLGVHLPTDKAARVHAMVMATTHSGEPADDDSRLVADIDLCELAQPRPDFLRITASIGRDLDAAALFERLLSRRSVYLTGHYRKRCERQARRNMEAFLYTESPLQAPDFTGPSSA